MRSTRTLPKSVSSKAATTPFSVKRSLDGSDLVNNNINNPSPLPFIFIPVNNMYIKALVDTGSTRTIIQQDALNRIRHKRVYPAQQCYHLADGASSLSIIGYVDLEIRIQHVRTYVTAAVAKSLSCPLILGQDWITYYHVGYNSSTNRLSVYNNIASVPIERVDETTFPVRLVQQIVLEPKSEHVVEAHVPISSSSAVLFHLNQKIHQIKSIIIPHSLLHVDKYITKLTIYNPNMYSCRLPANTNVGTITSLSSGDTISNVIDSNIDTTTMLTDDNNCKRKQRISQYAYSDSDCLGSNGDYDNCYYQQYISSINEQQQSNTSKCINMITNTNTNHLPLPINVSTIIQDAIKHITNKQQQQHFYEILHKYDKIFDTSSPTIAKTTIPHAIRTADHPPVNSRPYRGSEEQQRALQHILKIMSASNQIRPSTSPWSSPVLLVKKKDGDYRFVVDYRKLNSVTIKDSFPIPTIEATLKQLSGHSYFTKLDLKSGYFQIPIQEEDKQKTAFITTTGLWEFNVLPQGLKNAPPSFQRIMYNLLVNKREHYCLVYLDDIIIFSKSFDEHIHHLDDILSSLCKHNFQLNPPKCFFAKQQIDYLGHTIDIHGMRPLHDNIKAIQELSLPYESTLKQANEFIGGIGWYRKFIKNFAKIAAPIHAITNLNKNNQHKFYWGKEQRDAAKKLKEIISGPDLVLEFPDPTGSYVLSTDASNNGLGGILKQITTSGKLKILYYLSRKLSPSERKYSTTEKEALAMVWCIDRLRPYLLGVDFKVETDHCPLCNIHKKKSRNGRIDRWIVDVLQEYNILEIKYKKGKCHCDADLLSRYPQSNARHDENVILRKQQHGYLFPHTDTADDNDLNNCMSPAIVNVITRSKTKANVIHPTSSTSSTNVTSEPSPPLESTTTTTIPYIDLTIKRIKQEQKLDATIQNIITHMNHNDNSHYELVDDVLYRLIPRGTKNIRLPYVPRSLIKDVLFLFHDHPSSAHFGINRTYEKLKNKYYWPNMKNSIINYIQSCLQCSKHNIRRTKPSGSMHSTELPNEVLGIVGMDFWGPTHQASLHGNRYVITMTDYLSKFVFAKAVPTNTAEQACKFFYEIVCQFGPPTKLITDNGSHFISELTQAVVQQCNTTHILTTPYHPMSNGQTERFNATFAPSLAKLFDRKKQDWDIYLQSCVYAYNTGKHATTGLSPYQLMFGREPQPLMDRKQLKVRLSRPNAYWDVVRRSRLLFQQIATANALHQNSLAKTRFDKNRPNPQYHIGELVLIKVMDKSSKFQEQFEGPYRIIEQKGPSTFVVKIESPEEDDNPDYVKQVTICDMKNVITRDI
ncbi:unnamed protein product [Rotaria sp. Silwood2]|nr:unnamed protein product [Rotaria sp. Silwood2]